MLKGIRLHIVRVLKMCMRMLFLRVYLTEENEKKNKARKIKVDTFF